jgi:hypothetical protein
MKATITPIVVTPSLRRYAVGVSGMVDGKPIIRPRFLLRLYSKSAAQIHRRRLQSDLDNGLIKF